MSLNKNVVDSLIDKLSTLSVIVKKSDLISDQRSQNGGVAIHSKYLEIVKIITGN